MGANFSILAAKCAILKCAASIKFMTVYLQKTIIYKSKVKYSICKSICKIINLVCVVFSIKLKITTLKVVKNK